MKSTCAKTIFIAGLLALSLSLNGCMAKARSLHIAVNDFKNESVGAIDAIDTMWRAEIAPPPTSPAEASDRFVNDVLTLSNPIAPGDLPALLNPDALDADEFKKLEADWTTFLNDLRAQYVAFAAIFDNVERASFTGREEIAKAQPYIEKLTAQLAFFAKSIEDNPPQLIQQRTALIAELRTLQGSADPDKRQQIALWRDEWLAMETAENDLRDKTVQQCVKAAIMGKTVRDQIVAYGDLTQADLVEAINLGFQLAQSATGEDLTGLRTRTDEITQAIQADPAWSSSVDAILGQINTLNAGNAGGQS